MELTADAWLQIPSREGSNTPLRSRFARLRVRPAHDDAKRSEPEGGRVIADRVAARRRSSALGFKWTALAKSGY